MLTHNLRLGAASGGSGNSFWVIISAVNQHHQLGVHEVGARNAGGLSADPRIPLSSNSKVDILHTQIPNHSSYPPGSGHSLRC